VKSDQPVDVDPTLEGLNPAQRGQALSLWPDRAKRTEVRSAAASTDTGKRCGGPSGFGLRQSDLWRLIVTYPGVAICEMYDKARQDPQAWRDLEALRREMDGESLVGPFDEDVVEPHPAAPTSRSTTGWVEKMVSELGVKHETAEALYEQHKREPQRIRKAIFEVQQAMKDGTCHRPAGLFVSKLNKAKNHSSEGYSWAQ
jgi:hypothetical protein